MRLLILLPLVLCREVLAQTLTLNDAVRQALERQPEIEAAIERTHAADARVELARTGWKPRISYTESVQAGNNPIYVFGALLTQRQFSESNFRIDSLNRPDPLSNFQSVVSVEQTIWDAGRIRRQREAAVLGKAITEQDQERARLNTIARVVDMYFLSKMAQSTLDAARTAIRSAEADLERARTVRIAGMSTDADVLAIRVHLATMRETEIRRAADLEIAKAALNEAIGLPLNTTHELTTELKAAAVDAGEQAQPSADARPELKQARLAIDLSKAQEAIARTGLYPQIGARFAFEADRQQFVRRGGANWMFAASLRWNVFDGGESKARIREAVHSTRAAQAQSRKAESGVRLEIVKAGALLRAATEKIAVASAAVAMAEENLRITKNRYEAGLTTVTELLRSESAVADARSRHYATLYEQRTAAAALELAAGTLSPTSEVLK